MEEVDRDGDWREGKGALVSYADKMRGAPPFWKGPPLPDPSSTPLPVQRTPHTQGRGEGRGGECPNPKQEGGTDTRT